MQYKIVKDPALGTVLEITHGTNKLDFDISSLLSKNNNTETMFLAVNDYLNQVNVYTQTQLFELMAEFYIYKNKNIDYNKLEVVRHLEALINKACDIIGLEPFKTWMTWGQTGIVLPTNLNEEFIYDPDLNVTESKTYIKSQYLALVAVLQIVKMLAPILGEYNNYVSNISKQSLHKTFLLCLNSSLMNSAEIQKLNIYIVDIQNSFKTQGGSRNEQYIINKGLCSDDILENILAEIMLNKLFNADLYTPKSNIISIIFQTIKSKNSPAVAENEIIRVKKEIGNAGEDMSYFEDYRKTTDIPVGTVAEIQFALGDIPQIIAQLGVAEFYNEAFYRDELNYSKDLADYSINETQIYLLGWFLSKYIDPRALFYIEAKKIIELLTLARVVSWNKGHHFISLLLTSSKSLDATGNINLTSKTTLSKNVQDQINAKFSFFCDDESKTNWVNNSIVALFNNIVGGVWQSNANISHILQYNNDNKKGNRKLIIPANLADLLANYILI